ncbi:hypothetical protein SVIO_105030 [Streptomyces violaceusniger]|uniref:Histidinol dehydrogenase n=1 Tax=Streptomyces violaceusniger TaxID=68280 RepID=A0A4D4LKX7_STRVO|nr:hypothetical protein SVIO_105030 [Streptomyces violaceusniger]
MTVDPQRMLKRPADPVETSIRDSEVARTVAQVIADVRADGDAAVRHYSATFDGWAPDSFRLGPAQIEEAVSAVPTSVLDDIRFVQKQVRDFAQAQRASLRDIEVETRPGVFLGQKNLPVVAAGAYVPGDATRSPRRPI